MVIVVCVHLKYNLEDLYMSIIGEAHSLVSRIKRFHRLKNICGKSVTLKKIYKPNKLLLIPLDLINCPLYYINQ